MPNLEMCNGSMRTVRLYGEMGRLFGRVHRVSLSSNTPREAFQFLLSSFPKMTAYLMNAQSRGIGFAIFIGKKNIPREELEFKANDDIRVAPIILGSKQGGWLQIVLGAILVVVGAFAEVFSAGTSTELVILGASMIAGGVVQLLTPVPKLRSSKDSAANTPSYYFNGPVNTTAQGHPVPVIYGGPMQVGSAVASAGISTDSTVSVYNQPIPGGSSGGGGGDLVGVNRILNR